MKNLYFITVAIVLCKTLVFAQNPNIDHWELLLEVEDTVKFTSGNNSAPAGWNELNFNSSDWGNSELNGIGYGGVLNNFNMPNWLYGQVPTIYTRNIFNIVDTQVIESMMLEIFYADGFVAYINGTEVARANMGQTGDTTYYSQKADSTHTNSYNPDWSVVNPGFRIDKLVLQKCLKQGNNVLAIEIHNDTVDTQEHNYFAWLTVGLNTDGIHYLGEQSYLPNEVQLSQSNLPIVKIITQMGLPVQMDSTIKASMQIINDENTEYNSMQSTEYDFNGFVNIQYNESYDLLLPKLSYKIETSNTDGQPAYASLLGMPDDTEWILYAATLDKTIMRNVLTYNISNEIGMYAPRAEFVELVLNNRLLGTYVLAEKVKQGSQRVNIDELSSSDISGDDVSGGYILEIDTKEGDYDGWVSEYGSADVESFRTFYQYNYPAYNEIGFEQMVYIQTFMNDFEKSLRKSTFEDAETGYQKYLNVASFIDYFIINELTHNFNGYRLSTILYKDRDDIDGRLCMGPVYDQEFSLGNFEFAFGNATDGWAIDIGERYFMLDYQVPFWWNRLLQDANFVNKLENRWTELRSNQLHSDSIISKIDSIVDLTHEARIRNFEVWPAMFSSRLWIVDPIASDYDGEIAYLKSWITDRLTWIDNNIGQVREKEYYVSVNDKQIDKFLTVTAYPNPFVSHINFDLKLNSKQNITIEIFNVLGQKVAEPQNGTLLSGSYTFKWNLNDDNGNYTKSKVYLFTVKVDGQVKHTGKIMKY